MLSLIRLSPDHEVGLDVTIGLAAQLAHILNTDNGLPEAMRHPAHLPPETAESVLSFTRAWCLERDAQYFALVAQEDVVVGAVTISRIDLEARTARLGYVLASPYQDQAHELRAAASAFAHAGGMGIREISTTYSEQDAGLRAVWERSGYRLDVHDGRLAAYLS